MKSITKAAKAKVRQLCSECRGVWADGLPPGMYLRMGLGPRGRQRAVIPTRLGRRLRCLVHVQVPKLWTGGDRRVIRSREVERNGNAEVSHRQSRTSVASQFSGLGTPVGGERVGTPDSWSATSSLRSPAPKDISSRARRPCPS